MIEYASNIYKYALKVNRYASNAYKCALKVYKYAQKNMNVHQKCTNMYEYALYIY